MSDLRTAAQQALEALEKCSAQLTRLGYSANHADQVVPTVRAALEQPVQEEYTLVAWFNGKPVYSAPPRREWRGLTEEEIQSVIQLEREKRFQRRPPLPLSMTELSHAIEAKLKELNHHE
jgi:hypothetical protein